MTQAAHEARWRLEAGLDDDSVELRPMPRATFDLIMGWIWFVIWETLGIVLLLGPAVSPRSYRGQFEIVGGLAVGIAFMAVGLIFVVRHRWVARPGGMVRQMLLPFVPLKWERSYTGLTNFEVYKGIWRSGRGTSNVLRFYI